MHTVIALFLSISLLFSTNLLAGKVDINRATASELAKNLKGIGDKKARAIIKYRRKHGRFKSVNDLLNVKGIGKKTLEVNRKDLYLNQKELNKSRNAP